MSDDVTRLIDQYVGQQIPGGCEHCDAYQTVERFPGIAIDDGPGAFKITVHHDDWCPWWQRNQNRAARRAAVKAAKRRRPR